MKQKAIIYVDDPPSPGLFGRSRVDGGARKPKGCQPRCRGCSHGRPFPPKIQVCPLWPVGEGAMGGQTYLDPPPLVP